MFGTIRKHQTWLWAIIITLTIISFVIFFSPYQRMDRGRGVARLGSIHGEQITEERYVHAQRDIALQYFFMSGGRWPDDEARQMGFDVDRETYQWLLLQQKADQYQIHPGPETVAQVARDMISNFQRSGMSSAQAFFNEVLQPRGLTSADFERFVRGYLRIQQMISTVGVAGRLVPPEDLKGFYLREKQELDTEGLIFEATNYLAKVNEDPAAVARYYSNRLAEFRIPERIQVRYVEFPITNYYAQTEAELMKTNLNELVESNFQRMGTNYLRFGETPETAKVKIREELIRVQALNKARRAASAFASQLIDMEPARLENFDLVAKTNNLEIKTTAPFDRRDGPAEFEASPSFINAVFGLNATNDLFQGPLLGQSGAYVVAFERRVPSELPQFSSIQAKVEQQYKNFEAANLARRAGIEAHQKITNAIAQGKTFAAAATEAGVQPVKVPPFSLSTRTLPAIEDRIGVNELKQVAFATEIGGVSSFQSTADGGFILHVAQKLPVDDARMAAEMATFKNYVRQARQGEAFNQWFSREAQQGLRDTPIARAKPAPNMTAPAPAPAGRS